MKILFLIGNGFDLNVGLNTRYKDALNFYLNEQHSDVRIKRFKEDINGNFKNWSDFEKQLGIYTEKLNASDIDAFCFCVKHFKDSLIRYLKNEEKRINFENHREEIIHTFNTSLSNFYVNLNVYSQNLFKQMMTIRDAQMRIEYDFITFNYTSVLTKCLDFVAKQSIQQGQTTQKPRIGQILHIHGDITKNPLMGVDNAEQIKNQDFANSDKINNLIIKPIVNKKLKNYNDITAIQLIDSSDIICLFGLSLGDTDKTWWKHIGNRLFANAQLVIFNVVDKWNPIHADEEIGNIEREINKFYDVSNIGENIRQDIEINIHIGLNTDLFKVNLVYNTTPKSTSK